MKLRLLLLAPCLLLVSCGPTVWNDSNKYGQPRTIVVMGFASKYKSAAVVTKNKDVTTEIIVEEMDGTEVIKTLSGDIVTAKSVDAYYGHENQKVTTDGKVKINDSNNALKGKISDNEKAVATENFVEPES